MAENTQDMARGSLAPSTLATLASAKSWAGQGSAAAVLPAGHRGAERRWKLDNEAQRGQ